MGGDQATADALYLLDRIRQLGVDEVSERDLQRVCRRFHSRAELMPAVDRLVDHGDLIPLETPKPTGGRPPSPRYRVNTA